MLSTLVARRLLIADEHTVEVAHEALLREWPRLRGLAGGGPPRAAGCTASSPTRPQPNGSAHDRRPRTANTEARGWPPPSTGPKAHDPDLNDSERAFLAASTQQHDRQLRRARRTTAVLASLLVVVFGSPGRWRWCRRSYRPAQPGHRRRKGPGRRGHGPHGQPVRPPGSSPCWRWRRPAEPTQSSVETRGGLLGLSWASSARLTGFKQGFGNDLYAFGLAPDGFTISPQLAAVMAPCGSATLVPGRLAQPRSRPMAACSA